MHNDLETLLDTWEKLGPVERKVLLIYMMRLYAGQRRHGMLSTEKKDWKYEALEEAVDQSVYLCCALHTEAEKVFNRALADAEAEVINAEGSIPEEKFPFEFNPDWCNGLFSTGTSGTK